MQQTADQLIKVLALDKQVRAYLLRNTNTVNEAIRRHDLWPTATSVLGKVLSMGQMMGGMLKGDQALTLKLNGNGQLGNIIVDANSKGGVRGYVDFPHVNFINKDGFFDAMGIGQDGFLDVIKDLKMKDLFTSSIAITGDIARDFTYYFMESEQTNTAIILAIQVDVDNTCLLSGGLLIQLLPNATSKTIDSLESQLSELPEPSRLFKESSETILASLFGEAYEIIDSMPVSFLCPCSKEQFARSLLTLGAKELTTMKEEDHKIDIVCHYCNKTYHFDEQDIQQLIKEITNEKK
ncbi:MAG: Hsp33 family molecular chaperone HslO [Bacilli bacterium]